MEPGGTRNRLPYPRNPFLDVTNKELSPTSELLLYFAARAQNVDQVIQPALAQGAIVLSDRFTDSSLTYQGCGRGLGTDTVLALDKIACRGLKPDLTLLVDIDLATSLARAGKPNRKRDRNDRMEEQDSAFTRRFATPIRRLARRSRIESRSSTDGAVSKPWNKKSGMW